MNQQAFIIAGLGNPGNKYEKNRHNIGFLVIDEFLKKNTSIVNNSPKNKFQSEIFNLNTKSEKLILVKPQIFMNLSGQAIKLATEYFKVPLDKILIIHDDIDLPFGTIRFSKNSGAAGHNGIKSIIKQLGTQNFTRLRFGIKNEKLEKHNIPSENFVLEDFKKRELEKIKDILPEIIESIIFFTKNGFEKTANEFNGLIVAK